MAVTVKQLIRMIKFVAELKEKNFPNTVSFAEKMEKAVWENGEILRCSPRTVSRDIETLRNEFGAPIKFDPDRNGYYLAVNSWEFQCPKLCDELLTAAMLGARVAEDIMPEPLKTNIRNAADSHLSNNHSEFLDEAFIESLIVASGIKAAISPAVFSIVLDGWRSHEGIEFTYKSPNGETKRRKFEPHVISFHKGIWYTKGVDLAEGRIMVFAIHRMSDVTLMKKYFTVNKDIVDDVRSNGLFTYQKYDGIKLHCEADVAFYFYEHQKAKKLKISTLDDGSLIVILPPSTEYDVIRWVLGEAGKVQIVEPTWLKEKVVAAAKNVIGKHNIVEV